MDLSDLLNPAVFGPLVAATTVAVQAGIAKVRSLRKKEEHLTPVMPVADEKNPAALPENFKAPPPNAPWNFHPRKK